MPTTAKYGLPWPSLSAFLRDGAAAIGNLADAVESALLPPLLVTSGTAEANYGTDKTGEAAWDVTDDPIRKRGSWSSPGDTDRLVVPNSPGYYLVSASVRFGGKAESDWYDVQIRTRQVGSDPTTGTIWGHNRIEVPDTSATFTHVTCTAIVRIPDTTPKTGFVARMAYGGSVKPPDGSPADHKLSAIRLCAL